MRRFLFCCLCLALGIVTVHAGNETLTDPTQLLRARLGDLATAAIVSGCLPVVPASSLTLAAFACDGTVLDGRALIPVVQAATRPVGPLNAGNGTYWLALHRNVQGVVGSWTREALTHYLWIKSATAPAAPAGGYLFGKVTVAGGVITAVNSLANPNPVLSTRVGTAKNVMECGAKVDGVTDDGPALNDCLVRYPRVFMPEGILRTTVTILFNPNNSLEGVAVGYFDITHPLLSGRPTPPHLGSILRYTGSGVAVDMNFQDTTDNLAANAFFQLKNIAIQSKTGTIGIDVNMTTNVRIENVGVDAGFDASIPQTGFTVAGIRLSCTPIESPFNQAMISTIIDNVYVSNAQGYGLLANSCANLNGGSITNSRFIQNVLGGMYIDSRMAGWTITANISESNGGYQLFTRQLEASNVSHNYFEAGTSPMVFLRHGHGVTFDENTIRGAGSIIAECIEVGRPEEGLYFDGGSISHNVFLNCTTGVNLRAVRNTIVMPGSCPGSGSFSSFNVDVPVSPSGNLSGVNWLECGPVGGPNVETWAVTSGMRNTTVAFASTTAEQTLYTQTVRGGTLRGGALLLELRGQFLNNSAGLATLTLRQYWGGVKIQELRYLDVANAAGPHAMRITGGLWAAPAYGGTFIGCDLKADMGSPNTVSNAVTVDTAQTVRFSQCFAGSAISVNVDTDQIYKITAQMSVSNSEVAVSSEFVALTRHAP